MEAEQFEKALRFTLHWEGGFSQHPQDPGGATNRGITQTTYDAWRKSQGLQPRSVREIEQPEVEHIYRSQYWEPWCPDLSWPLNLATFDTAVNFGWRGTAFLWQPVIGVAVDGVWGPVTQAKTLELQTQKGPMWCAAALVAARIRFRIQRVSTRPDQKVFLAGWIARDTDLLQVMHRDPSPSSPARTR